MRIQILILAFKGLKAKAPISTKLRECDPLDCHLFLLIVES